MITFRSRSGGSQAREELTQLVEVDAVGFYRGSVLPAESAVDQADERLGGRQDEVPFGVANRHPDPAPLP